MTSACPLSNLVAECITISAPSSSGRWSHGDIIVLSTQNRAPTERQASDRAEMSAIRRLGLLGDSTRRIADLCSSLRTASTSQTSTYLVCTLYCWEIWSSAQGLKPGVVSSETYVFQEPHCATIEIITGDYGGTRYEAEQGAQRCHSTAVCKRILRPLNVSEGRLHSTTSRVARPAVIISLRRSRNLQMRSVVAVAVALATSNVAVW
jgi:hypothetical protein